MDQHETIEPIFDREEITIIGDSHISLPVSRTSAFYCRVLQAFGERYRVHFAGFPGKNLTEICTMLPFVITPKRKIRAIIIAAGTNSDCRDNRWQSIEDIRMKLQDALAKQDSNIFIILNTPPPILEDLEYKIVVDDGHESKILWREQKRIAEIAAVIREFKGPNVGICDLYKTFSEEKGKWHSDSVHLSDDAEEVWAKLIIEELGANGIMGETDCASRESL